MNYLLRRRKLGRTSCREISAQSQSAIGVVRNDKVTPDTLTDASIIFRWGCTANVPHGVQVINKAAAIHTVCDKRGFREILEEHELCPATWLDKDDVHITYPCVVRPRFHAQGKDLTVCNNHEELLAACQNRPEGQYYISELINKVAEYRVFVVSGRAVCVAQKTPGNPDEVAWNVAKGGKFENVRWNDWPLKAVKRSIEAFKLSGLDFGGVDVMLEADGAITVLEINSAPSLTSPYRQQCFAKSFDHIIEHGKDTIPLIEEPGGYLKFIHPAVCEKAKLALNV